MKYFITVLLAMTAAPALAHDGMHLHPHADHSSWLPLIAGSIAVGLVALLAWGRK